MATIAKGMITLSSVNDAFSVSLNPNSCVINADWDGSNPRLDNAYTDIRVYRGDVTVEFAQPTILGYSNNAVTATVTKIDNQTWRIKFATIDTSSLNGKVNLKIVVGTEFATTISFGYTVVRETSMLYWILDWEGRAKTEIAGEHIITPKIFVGKSENGGQLTGTYIGPAFDGSGRTGVFGYSAGVEIFHLDNTGGMIGGWQITTGGITTADGNLKILSEGSIISAPGGTLAWELKKDGSATFAKGNVKFSANGDAEFTGKITSKSGSIGGWTLTDHQLYSNRIILDSQKGFIGINANSNQAIDATTGNVIFPESLQQGIKLWYSSSIDWGMAGWFSGNKIFQLGSSNSIAGWHFDEDSIWSGENAYSSHSGGWIYAKSNTEGTYTVIANAITIGSNGIRSNFWRLEKDGSGALAGGQIWWDTTGYCEFKGTLKAATIIGASITGGTIQAVDYIKSENDSWQLNKDGSGKFANGNVNWGTDGHVSVAGGLRADTFELAICKTMENGYIDGSTGSFISLNTGATATVILPALSLNCARIFHLMIPSDNQTLRIGFKDENVSYSIPGEENISEDSGMTPSNKFDEDGFASISGFGGDWIELIGIKTSRVNLQAILNRDLTGLTSKHIWAGGELKPIITVQPLSAKAAPSTSLYQTHWFLLPKSSRMHWWMMAAMGLNLGSS